MAFGKRSKLIPFARRLRHAIAGACVVIIGILLAAMVRPDWGQGLAIQVDGDLPHGWSLALATGYFALILAALMQLWAMLGDIIANNIVFTPQAIRRFRRFALFLLGAAIFAIILPPLANLWLAHLAGKASARVSLDIGDLLFLLISAAIYFVARLFEMAAAFEQDSQSIV